MCGIVGLFCKTETHRHELGRLTAVMLREMRDRGPDSAGFASYDAGVPGRTRITVLAEGIEVDWGPVAAAAGERARRRGDRSGRARPCGVLHRRRRPGQLASGSSTTWPAPPC